MTQWHNIAAAIDFYVKRGYSYIDVPWTASEHAIYTTLPTGLRPSMLQGSRFLVGSAEQSFIDMMLKGTLKVGKHVAVTPCFRDEDEDEYHYKYFMKVELIDYAKSTDPNYNSLVPQIEWSMVAYGLEFFGSLGSSERLTSHATEEGADIYLDGTEIGSYGVRQLEHEGVIHKWCYGTAIAEPRFSRILFKK